MRGELTNGELDSAKAAVAFAGQVRVYHRRRTKRGDERREADIESARTRLREAMTPIRTAIGRFPYGAQTETAELRRDEIRAVAEQMGAERRKLTKMASK